MSTIALNASILFFCGAIIGYLAVNYLAKKLKSIRFSFGGYIIHLHHWFFASVALLIIFFTGLYNSLSVLFLGLGGGIIFEGIYCYNDWHKIISKKQEIYFNK